jgi:hypothetical protein
MPVQEVRPPIFERFGKSLHQRFDEIVHEPLPERWTDLIKRLDAEEARLDKTKVARLDHSGDCSKPIGEAEASS